MKTVYILWYSQLCESDMAKSIEAFVQKTSQTAAHVQTIAYQQGGLPQSSYKSEQIAMLKQGAIYQYKIGQISEPEFITRMNKALGSNLSATEFKYCWNAMCTLQQETKDKLHALADLQENLKFGLHVMGSTNKMQSSYIEEQLRQENIKLKMTHTYSFETGQLEPSKPNSELDEWKTVNLIDLTRSKDVWAEIQNSNPKKSIPSLKFKN